VSLTLYFIVEPPVYQTLACYLAASIRRQFGTGVALVGYCPEHRRDEVDERVVTLLRRLDCDLRTFRADGRFDPAYPHGNKILATLEPRDTEFSGFMDSDILCIRANRVRNIVREGAVSLTLAASMNWAPQSVWDDIYGACGMEVPRDRVMLARQRKGAPRVPYYSSGFFTFPERHRDAEGRRFPEVWMDVARTVDAMPGLPGKRPFLDQMTLPLAIGKAGLTAHLLPEEQHWILGGRLRGEPMPEDRKIRTVHYRRWLVLKEAGLAGFARSVLRRQAGVRRVSEVGTADDAWAGPSDQVGADPGDGGAREG
jgi:hypothetical protein